MKEKTDQRLQNGDNEWKFWKRAGEEDVEGLGIPSHVRMSSIGVRGGVLKCTGDWGGELY